MALNIACHEQQVPVSPDLVGNVWSQRGLVLKRILVPSIESISTPRFCLIFFVLGAKRYSPVTRGGEQQNYSFPD